MLQKLTVKVFNIFSYLLSIFVLRYINSGEQTWRFWENPLIRPQCGLFFLFPVMEDMLTVGPHYLRLHNLKSTSGLIKNSCSVGITSEKFRAHKNNLWSIIPSPPAPRLMCIFILGYGVLMLFLLFLPESWQIYFHFYFFYPRLASLKNASEHINVAVRWTECFGSDWRRWSLILTVFCRV